MKEQESIIRTNYPIKKTVIIVTQDGMPVIGSVFKEDHNGNPIVVCGSTENYQQSDGVWHPVLFNQLEREIQIEMMIFYVSTQKGFLGKLDKKKRTKSDDLNEMNL